jgi:hypothetical protein
MDYFLFYKTSCLNEEVNRTKPSPSARVPWSNLLGLLLLAGHLLSELNFEPSSYLSPFVENFITVFNSSHFQRRNVKKKRLELKFLEALFCIVLKYLLVGLFL